MRRPGYGPVLDMAHDAIHKRVDLWALARCVGGNHHTPFGAYAVANTFKGILHVSGSEVRIENHVALADWLRKECCPGASYRDRNRKQLRYAAKAFEEAAVCAVVTEALVDGTNAIVEDMVTAVRAWLAICTTEERAAVLAVSRLGGGEAVRDFMGDALAPLRAQAERLTCGRLAVGRGAMSDDAQGLRERRRRLVQELTAHGLVRLHGEGVVDLGVTDQELQPVVEYARIRWAYAVTVPRSLDVARTPGPELWVDPWARALLHGIAAEHPGIAAMPETARARRVAAHLHHGAEQMSDEVRAALALVHSLGDLGAVREYLLARGALASRPSEPTTDAWQRAIARVLSQEVPRRMEGDPADGVVRVW